MLLTSSGLKTQPMDYAKEYAASMFRVEHTAKDCMKKRAASTFSGEENEKIIGSRNPEVDTFNSHRVKTLNSTSHNPYLNQYHRMQYKAGTTHRLLQQLTRMMNSLRPAVM
jgi:hypothetical protein